MHPHLDLAWLRNIEDSSPLSAKHLTNETLFATVAMSSPNKKHQQQQQSPTRRQRRAAAAARRSGDEEDKLDVDKTPRPSRILPPSQSAFDPFLDVSSEPS